MVEVRLQGAGIGRDRVKSQISVGRRYRRVQVHPRPLIAPGHRYRGGRGVKAQRKAIGWIGALQERHAVEQCAQEAQIDVGGDGQFDRDPGGGRRLGVRQQDLRPRAVLERARQRPQQLVATTVRFTLCPLRRQAGDPEETGPDVEQLDAMPGGGDVRRPAVAHGPRPPGAGTAAGGRERPEAGQQHVSQDLADGVDRKPGVAGDLRIPPQPGDQREARGKGGSAEYQYSWARGRASRRHAVFGQVRCGGSRQRQLHGSSRRDEEAVDTAKRITASCV